MKRLLRYILIAGLLIAATLMLYTYQQYMGEDTDPSAEQQASPLIHKRLNAIVTNKSAAKVGRQPIIEITYRDMDTEETSSFVVNQLYQQSIYIGDTLTKEKGDKIMLVYQKDGRIATVPIE
jgi:hypothetical protein